MKFSKIAGSLTLLLMLISTTIQAADSVDHVLGVRDGVYQGRGVLESQVFPVPNLGFMSRRTLSNGQITATTRAYLITNDSANSQKIRQMVLGPVLTALLEMPIAEATAQLKVHYTDSENFKLIDLKTKSIAGSGSCTNGTCSFSARVNSGLELTETWIPTAQGFLITGHQNFYGLRSTYTAQMNPPPAQK